MRSRRIGPAAAACAVLALTMARLSAEDAPHREPPKPKEPVVQFLLETERVSFSTDDPITLTATLWNKGDEDLVIDAGLMAAQGQYDVLDNSEKAVDSGSWSRETDKDWDKHRVPLKAGKRLTRFVSLGQHLGALAREEGRLRVFLEFCDAALGGDEAKPRCVASNAVIIRIQKDEDTRFVHPVAPGR